MTNQPELCSYCPSPATTRDHVPPKALFAPPRPTSLITVPSCRPCNEGAHLDDQYFVRTILCYHRVADLAQAAAQVARMLRRTQEWSARGYVNLLVSRLRAVAVTTVAGLHLGTAPALTVDRARMDRVVQRITRGLFRNVRGRKLAEDSQVLVHTDPEAVLMQQEYIESLLRSGSPKTIQDGVFWFTTVAAKDNPKVSAWLLVFFGVYACFVIVTEP